MDGLEGLTGGDGLATDHLDLDHFDADGDGANDMARLDTDDDGAAEAVFLDHGRDGSFDHAVLDTDGDGAADLGFKDVDNDGTVDQVSEDRNGDGFAEVFDSRTQALVLDTAPVAPAPSIAAPAEDAAPIVLDPAATAVAPPAALEPLPAGGVDDPISFEAINPALEPIGADELNQFVLDEYEFVDQLAAAHDPGIGPPIPGYEPFHGPLGLQTASGVELPTLGNNSWFGAGTPSIDTILGPYNDVLFP